MVMDSIDLYSEWDLNWKFKKKCNMLEQKWHFLHVFWCVHDVLNRALNVSAGQLTVEGGNCSYPSGLACSSILRPQPITCLALPSVCHRGREPGCGYQACCEPQMCCLHGIPPQPDLPSLDKSQLEGTLYNSNCVQSALISASLHQSQQLQRCWDPDSSSQCPPPSSPVPMIQLSCGRGSTSQPQATASAPQSQAKSYLYHQHQREVPLDGQTQPSADRSRPGQCQGKLSTSAALQQDLSHAAVDRDVMTEVTWEERCRVEEACGRTADSRDPLDDEPQQDRREQSLAQQQQQQQQQLHVPAAVEMRKDQQRNRSPLMLRDHRDGRVSTYKSFLMWVFKSFAKKTAETTVNSAL